MTWSLRTRLTALSGLTAGLLFAVIFLEIVLQTQAGDLQSRQEILTPALDQAAAEFKEAPTHPDLSEVTSVEPNLSLAAFDGQGRHIASEGKLSIQAPPPAGTQEIDGEHYLIAHRATPQGELVGALRWTNEWTALHRLAVLLLILWPLLTGCVLAATWFGSRTTFEQLSAMARRAGAMGGSDLTERLPLPNDADFDAFVLQLNGLLDRISASVLAQERFVADAAHELRTPVSILLAEIDSALERERTLSEYRGTLVTIQSETERLASLAEMLLLSASIGSEPAEPIDLAVAAEMAHARWVDRYSAKEVTLNLDVEAICAPIQEREAEVILDNLLSNALRASPEKSHTTIEVHPNGKQATIAVTDQGAGVPADIADRVFDRLVRGDRGRNRREGGFGIGLSICRRIIEARGGSIELDRSQPGGRFIVRLPTVNGL